MSFFLVKLGEKMSQGNIYSKKCIKNRNKNAIVFQLLQVHTKMII